MKTSNYVEEVLTLTGKEAKMKLFHPKALNFEQASVPLTSQKQ